MANDLNMWTGTGRLGKDPEQKLIGNGTQVTNFSIAVGSQWKDRNTGEKKERTEWLDISAYGPLGDNVFKYCSKGSQVLVVGEIRIRKSEKDGQTRYFTEINANKVQFIGGKNESQPVQKPQQASAAFEDDIPF